VQRGGAAGVAQEPANYHPSDFQDAIERVIAGLEKKNKLINPHERQVVAYHESGHAIVGHFTPGADPVQKVSIIPRGIGALGYTLQTPLEDRFLMSRSELLGKIKGLLGGRAAEDLVFGEVSTGAANDLEKVADIVRNMLTVYGMSEADAQPVAGGKGLKQPLPRPGTRHAAPVGDPGDADRQ
jgi:cell division protease FtsH